jgi:hypothetical protein
MAVVGLARCGCGSSGEDGGDGDSNALADAASGRDAQADAQESVTWTNRPCSITIIGTDETGVVTEEQVIPSGITSAATFVNDEHDDGASSSATVYCGVESSERHFSFAIGFSNYVWSEVVPHLPALGGDATDTESMANKQSQAASAEYVSRELGRSWKCNVENGGIWSWTVSAAVQNRDPASPIDFSKWHSNGSFHGICPGWSPVGGTPVPGTVTIDATF